MPPLAPPFALVDQVPLGGYGCQPLVPVCYRAAGRLLNLALSYDAIDPTADGHVTLNGHASGFYTPVFLDKAIRSHLKGMSPSKAHAFLQSLRNVVDARVVQSPFGLPWLPLFSSRITLKIQEVSSSSSG